MNEHEPPHAEAAEHEPLTRPRIYVASLSDYNAAIPHGAWIDANQEVEAIEEQVQMMLSASPQPLAEEYAIHDYEGFGPLQLSEYENLATVAELAGGITSHGAAFAHWANYVGPSNPHDLRRFEDAYLGRWQSLERYAEELLEDLGIDVDSLGPEQLQPYIRFDIEAFASDLATELHAVEDRDGVYLFEP